MNRLTQNIVDEEIHSKDILLTYFTRLVCTDLDGNHCRSYVGHLLGLIRLIDVEKTAYSESSVTIRIYDLF